MAQTQTATAATDAAELAVATNPVPGRAELGHILRTFQNMHDYLQRQPPQAEPGKPQVDLRLEEHSSVTSWAQHHPPPLPRFACTPAAPSIRSVEPARPPPALSAKHASSETRTSSQAASGASDCTSITPRAPSASFEAASAQPKVSSPAEMSTAMLSSQAMCPPNDAMASPPMRASEKDTHAADSLYSVHKAVAIPAQAVPARSMASASVKALASPANSKSQSQYKFTSTLKSSPASVMTMAAATKQSPAATTESVSTSVPASAKAASAGSKPSTSSERATSAKSVAPAANPTPSSSKSAVSPAKSATRPPMFKPKPASVHSAALSARAQQQPKHMSLRSVERSQPGTPSVRSSSTPGVGGSGEQTTASAVPGPVTDRLAKSSASASASASALSPSAKSLHLPIRIPAPAEGSEASSLPSLEPLANRAPTATATGPLVAEPLEKRVKFTASRGAPSVLSSITSGSATIVHKRIVVLFDGAHRSRLAVQPVNADGAPTSVRPGGYFTNIALLAQTLKSYSNKIDDDRGYRIPQLQLYLPDVEVRTAEGGFQDSIGMNVENAWAFLSDNYRSGDELYLFGFSRGAVAARVLGSLIGWSGILPKAQAVFIKPIWEAYRRRDPGKPSSLLHAARVLRKATGRWPNLTAADTAAVTAQLGSSNEPMTPHVEPVDIRVIGVFDTVAQNGWPPRMASFDPSLSACVQHAFQALALAEERHSLYPALWHQSAAAADTQVLRQMWFQGTHGDVGGGYGHHGLSDTTLAWMVALLTDHRNGPMLSFDLRRLKRLQDQRTAWAQQCEHRPHTLDTKPRYVEGRARHSRAMSRWMAMHSDTHRGEAIHHSVVVGGAYSKERSPQFEWLRKHAPDRLDSLWAEAASEDSLLPTERYLQWDGGAPPIKRTGSGLSLVRTVSKRSARSQDSHRSSSSRSCSRLRFRNDASTGTGTRFHFRPSRHLTLTSNSETLSPLEHERSLSRPRVETDESAKAEAKHGDRGAERNKPLRSKLRLHAGSLSLSRSRSRPCPRPRSPSPSPSPSCTRSRSHDSQIEGTSLAEENVGRDAENAADTQKGAAVQVDEPDADARRPRNLRGFGAPSLTRPRVSMTWLRHRRTASTPQTAEDRADWAATTSVVRQAEDDAQAAPSRFWVITIPKPTWRGTGHRSLPRDLTPRETSPDH